MSTKKFVRDYLSFNRKERIGILSLAVLICLVYFLPAILKNKQGFPLKESQLLARLIDSAQSDQPDSTEIEVPALVSHYEPRSKPAFIEGELFEFNPNLLNAEGWQRLGLNGKTTKTILKYVSKGGKFRTADDLQRVWGMPDGFFERVKPFIRIEPDSDRFERREYEKPERKSFAIDINNSDTTAWIGLPGIGSKLALRIINFREKLGGFYSIEQVKETFGLHDSVFQKIKPFMHISGEVKKININNSTKDELKTHPYIRWNIANAIVEYRNQHGNFQSMDDLKKVSLITEDVAIKLQAYINFF